jgi:hypothetical protein
MDWARAIERNRDALMGIVAVLFAMLGLTGTATIGRIPRALNRAVLRVLRPAESAVRRLIVIAARGIVVKPSPVRPMSKGLVITGKGAGRVSFQLIDPRERVRPWRPKPIPDHKRPRIWVPFDDTPANVAIFRPEDFGRPVGSPVPPADDGRVDAARLGRRLMAIKQALGDLPAQAKRLVRWQMRRKAMASPKFTSPLRPGDPPGHRRKPTHEVDEVLSECDSLAWDATRLDTS